MELVVAAQQVTLVVAAQQVELIVAAQQVAQFVAVQNFALAVTVMVAPLHYPTKVEDPVAVADSAAVPPSYQPSTVLMVSTPEYWGSTSCHKTENGLSPLSSERCNKINVH